MTVPDTRTRARIALRPTLFAGAVTLLLVLFDPRIVSAGIWGLGSLVVYARVFQRRRRRWLAYHDPRSFRDLLGGFALLLTAAASALAIGLILLGQPGTGLRLIAVATAMGAFLGAGIVMDDEEPDVPAAAVSPPRGGE